MRGHGRLQAGRKVQEGWAWRALQARPSARDASRVLQVVAPRVGGVLSQPAVRTRWAHAVGGMAGWGGWCEGAVLPHRSARTAAAPGRLPQPRHAATFAAGGAVAACLCSARAAVLAGSAQVCLFEVFSGAGAP